MTTHQMNLQPVPFEAIKSGRKQVEIRLFDEKRQKIKIGDEIIFSKEPEKEEKLKAQVVELLHFKTFSDLIDAYEPTIFGRNTKEELLENLSKYYSSEQEKEFGVWD